MAAENKYAIGVDIGGTNIKLGIISETGKILNKALIETLAEGGPDVVVSQLKKGIKELLKKNEEKIAGIGIGCAGSVNQSKGIVENPPNLPKWEKVPLSKIINKEFGYDVYLDNDANVAAIGEMYFGAGKKLNSFIMVTLGTGVGGGIILNRNILHGDFGAAGEIGHIVIDYKGPLCNCGSYGCIEAYVGNHYLVKRIQQEIKNKPGTKIWDLINHDIEKLSPRIIDEAAQLGDEYAKSVIIKTGEYLGCAFASLANIMDIGTFIVGGGVAGFGDPLFKAAQKKTIERVLIPMKKRIKILPAKLKNDAGIQGASALVFYGNKKS
ncbi:MAG TPA: ROK family protein [Ignavibacteriaceae bacterium]|nr:ROK family protein [Ignavibacteriaceae bacterium]